MALPFIIGIAIGILGFLAISFWMKRVSKDNGVWVLVAVVLPSLLPQLFMIEQTRQAYILGWMIAISVLILVKVLTRKTSKT